MKTIDDLIREAYSHWDDAKVLARAGQELHGRTRLDAAREILGRAVELDPTDWESWEALGYSWLRGFETEKGLAVLREGIEATGSDYLKGVLSGFTADEEEAARLKEEIAGTAAPAAKAGNLWSRLHGGDAEGAFNAMREVQEEHPENDDVRDNYLWMLISAKQQGVEGVDLAGDGLPICDGMIEKEPDRIGGHVMKIQMLNGLEDWDGVLAATADALGNIPDEETIMLFRGRAFREKGDEERAAHWFARAIGAKPSFAGARVDLGKLYEKQGKLELAEELFREIPVANPDYPVGPMSMALFCARQDRLDEAEKIFVETWPALPVWFKGSLQHNPDAAPLLEREAVKKLLETEDGKE